MFTHLRLDRRRKVCFLVRSLCCLVWLAAWGCAQRDPAGVTVTSRRVHRALLLSELQTAAQPADLLDTRFEYSNAGAAPATLQYQGAGCVCYQVTCEGRPLMKGDLLTIPAESSLTVAIGVTPPTAAAESDYTAQFNWLPPGADPVALPITLTLPVYADLSVTPSVLTAGYRPGRPLAPLSLRALCSGRSQTEVLKPPVVGQTSLLLKLGDWRLVTVEQPAEGLWRGTWDLPVEVTLPEGFREQLATSIPLSVGKSASNSVGVLIQPQVGIRAPGEVQFGLLRIGEPRRRRVQLASADRVDFEVLGVTSNDPRCRVTVDAQTPADRHWLEIEVELPEHEPLTAKLVCQTDHSEAKEVQMTVRAAPEPSTAVTAAPESR